MSGCLFSSTLEFRGGRLEVFGLMILLVAIYRSLFLSNARLLHRIRRIKF